MLSSWYILVLIEKFIFLSHSSIYDSYHSHHIIDIVGAVHHVFHSETVCHICTRHIQQPLNFDRDVREKDLSLPQPTLCEDCLMPEQISYRV